MVQRAQLATSRIGATSIWATLGPPSLRWLLDMGSLPMKRARASIWMPCASTSHFTKGCSEPGCGLAARGTKPAPGFVAASGALGCGYYKGHLSTQPYTVATAVTGAAFGAEMYNIEHSSSSASAAQLKSIVQNAASWIAKTAVDVDGSIAYILDGVNDTSTWPLDTASYVTEGIIAIDRHLPELRPMLRSSFGNTVQWLVKTQNADGTWGKLRSEDQQRAPRVVSLLAWWQQQQYQQQQPQAVAPRKNTSAVDQAIDRYFNYLLEANHSAAYGVLELTRTTGFVGLALADQLEYGATFGPQSSQ